MRGHSQMASHKQFQTKKDSSARGTLPLGDFNYLKLFRWIFEWHFNQKDVHQCGFNAKSAKIFREIFAKNWNSFRLTLIIISKVQSDFFKSFSSFDSFVPSGQFLWDVQNSKFARWKFRNKNPLDLIEWGGIFRNFPNRAVCSTFCCVNIGTASKRQKNVY